MLSSISRLYQLIPIRVLLEIHRCEHADGQADHRRAGHQPERAEDRRLRTGRRRTKLGGLVAEQGAVQPRPALDQHVRQQHYEEDDADRQAGHQQGTESSLPLGCGRARGL